MTLIVTLNVLPAFNFVKDDLKIKIFYYYIRKFVAYDILVFHIIDLHKVSTAEWQLFQYIITNHNSSIIYLFSDPQFPNLLFNTSWEPLLKSTWSSMVFRFAATMFTLKPLAEINSGYKCDYMYWYRGLDSEPDYNFVSYPHDIKTLSHGQHVHSLLRV